MKKFVFVICWLVGYNQLVSAQENFLPEFSISPELRVDTDDVNSVPTINFCDGIYGPRCLNCNTLLTCAQETINSQSCSSINPSTPYCSGNACTATTETVCNLPFRCTTTGPLPHPYDCTMYYFCLGPLRRAVAYQCPTSYVYDSKTGQCKLRRAASDCQTINCSNLSNNYLIFAADKSILAYCADTDTTKETILFRCTDSNNMEYNAATLTCTYICKAAGRFPDRLDCTKFYECYGSGNIYAFYHQKCPENYGFDPITKTCISAASRCQNELS